MPLPACMTSGLKYSPQQPLGCRNEVSVLRDASIHGHEGHVRAGQCIRSVRCGLQRKQRS
jgi:hypothetical protein